MNALTITASYALLIFAGGLTGFYAASSLPSLVASTIFSALLAIAAYGFTKDQSWAFPLAIAVSSLLTLFFGYRSFATQGIVPLVMFAISLISTFLLFKTRG
ncbi:MAG: TMEM14 family protein [Parachlamydiaceae bacterium]